MNFPTELVGAPHLHNDQEGQVIGGWQAAHAGYGGGTTGSATPGERT
jgi:hypothetical protein